MGILDKIKFWKKDEDEFGFDDFSDKTMQQSIPPDNTGFSKDPIPGQTEKSPFDQPSTEESLSPPNFGEVQKPISTPTAPAPPSVPQSSQRDIELINSKLDTIKALLASMDQRMSNIEKAAGVQKKQERLW
jgi:hypothetical protein